MIATLRRRDRAEGYASGSVNLIVETIFQEELILVRRTLRVADKFLTIRFALFGHRYPVILALFLLVGGLSRNLNAEPFPEIDPLGEERAGRVDGLFPGEEESTTLSASALHPLTDVRRDYLAVFGILAASVFISLRKRPHRAASRIR